MILRLKSRTWSTVNNPAPTMLTIIDVEVDELWTKTVIKIPDIKPKIGLFSKNWYSWIAAFSTAPLGQDSRGIILRIDFWEVLSKEITLRKLSLKPWSHQKANPSKWWIDIKIRWIQQFSKLWAQFSWEYFSFSLDQYLHHYFPPFLRI